MWGVSGVERIREPGEALVEPVRRPAECDAIVGEMDHRCGECPTPP